jgi:hypothetical protein
VSAGVPLALGTDAGVVAHGTNGHEHVDFVMKSGQVVLRDGQVLGRSAAGIP